MNKWKFFIYYFNGEMERKEYRLCLMVIRNMCLCDGKRRADVQLKV